MTSELGKQSFYAYKKDEKKTEVNMMADDDTPILTPEEREKS